MLDHECTVAVDAAPDEAFRTLTDPSNLPRYVATMVSAVPGEGNRLRVAADVQGRHEEGEARFQVDEAERWMEWAGKGELATEAGSRSSRLRRDRQ